MISNKKNIITSHYVSYLRGSMFPDSIHYHLYGCFFVAGIAKFYAFLLMAPMKRTSKRLYWNYGMLLFDKYLHGFFEKVIHWTIWYILNCCHRDVVRSHATYPLTRPPQQKRTKNTFQTLWKPINPHASFCFFHMTIKQKSSKKQKNIEKQPHYTSHLSRERQQQKKITVMAPGQAKRWTENFCRRQVSLRGTF